MKLGFALPQSGPLAEREGLREVARRAEASGASSLSVFERILSPLQPLDEYPASPDGKLPEFARSVLEPLEVLTYVAAVTERARLMTAVLILPCSNPVQLARRVATLDTLSGGRVELGIGLGWSRDEYQASGVPFAERGPRCDEMLELMIRIWTEEAPSHQGRFYQLAPSHVGPKPIQRPHPPVLVGGFSQAAYQRAARFGAGWMPAGPIPAEALAQMAHSYRQTLEGRPGRVVLLSFPDLTSERGPMAGTMEQMGEDLEQYARAGVDEVVLAPMAALLSGMEALEPYWRLLERFR